MYCTRFSEVNGFLLLYRPKESMFSFGTFFWLLLYMTRCFCIFCCAGLRWFGIRGGVCFICGDWVVLFCCCCCRFCCCCCMFCCCCCCCMFCCCCWFSIMFCWFIAVCWSIGFAGPWKLIFITLLYYFAIRCCI